MVACVLSSVQCYVEKHPNAVATLWAPTMQGAPKVCTYAELWHKAHIVALSLRQKGDISNTGMRVGVALEEGPLLPLLELAILLSRAVIVPLDISEPSPRLALLLEDAELAVIITKENAHHEKLKLILSKRVLSLRPCKLLVAEHLLDEGSWGVPACKVPAPAPAVDPKDVSHIFFTSGSTGRPKGCVVAYSALASYCFAKNTAHRVEKGCVCFVASAHTFDPSLGDFFATLCVGGTLALAPRRTLFCSLGACLAITGATHVLTTPSLFATVDVLEKLPALRVVALGGEAMPTRLAQQWASRVTLINTYGVTECCVYQACAVITPDASSTKALGSPLPGNQLLLVAGDGNDITKLVPERSNEEGEIWIAGAQVGKGYLNRVDLTEARFKEHHEIGPLFRTGDLAVAAPGGWELVGRRDTQVKIRGRRVEVDEVEHVLLCAAGPVLPSPASSSATTVAPRGPFAALLADAAVTAMHGQLVAWCVPSDRLGDVSSLDAGLLQVRCTATKPRPLLLTSPFDPLLSLSSTREVCLGMRLVVVRSRPLCTSRD